ncbi:hypothetical protein [Streptomyces sp. TRM68367]|uniref:hypothetical protein n=1 Tax=Streptomyces sp. TRM68367 TaxID=2758415 RepID=UPI00165ADCDF|nr:hypothetical protein [Streptomyces sp. TRM68367]MBC9725517.1 hypothetical protein [Streptomyces sp. TRM68367]
MSKRQVQKMLRLMASGEPVELTSPMASVKKLARLAFVAQQFGYEYADVRQSSGRNGALIMLIVPDPGPQARARAAQNWAQYPNAGDGVSLPPVVPDAFELLKARINFDLTGRNAEKRMLWAAVGITLGCVVLGVRGGADADAFVIAAVVWAVFMGIFGLGLFVTRKRNAKFAARLQAAGFAPVTDETGRLRYLPPGGQFPGHGNPFAGAYGGQAAGPYGAQAAGAYGTQPTPGAPGAAAAQAPGGYGYGQPAQGPAPYAPQSAQPSAPGPYAPQPAAPGPYAAQPAPPPGPYGTPQAPGPYAPPPQPYPQAQQPQQPYPPQPQSPLQPHQPPQNPQAPYPQQNPQWQPPQH